MAEKKFIDKPETLARGVVDAQGLDVKIVAGACEAMRGHEALTPHGRRPTAPSPSIASSAPSAARAPLHPSTAGDEASVEASLACAAGSTGSSK